MPARFATFRRIFVHNWRAKIASLLAATVVWLLVKRDLSQPPPPVLKPALRSLPRFP